MLPALLSMFSFFVRACFTVSLFCVYCCLFARFVFCMASGVSVILLGIEDGLKGGSMNMGWISRNAIKR